MTTYLDIFWQLKFQCACPPNVVIWQTFKMNTICVITLFRVIEERVRERMCSCVNNRLIHQSHIVCFTCADRSYIGPLPCFHGDPNQRRVLYAGMKTWKAQEPP